MEPGASRVTSYAMMTPDRVGKSAGRVMFPRADDTFEAIRAEEATVTVRRVGEMDAM